MDDFLNWLSQRFTLLIAIQSAVIGVIMVVLAGLGSEPPHTFRQWVQILSVGTLVSILVGWVAQEYIHIEVLRHAVIGLCAVVSRDIFFAVKSLGSRFAKDPLGTLAALRNKKE